MRVRDRHRAEDVVQETFLAGIKGIGSYSGKSSVRSWLTGILKHKIVDYYRESNRGHENEAESIDDLYGKLGHLNTPAQRWKGNPRDAYEQKEFWVQLDDCISKLPDRHGQIFTLHEIDGHSSEEICKDLAISPSNYWVMLHRCRIALRQCLHVNWFKR